MLIYDAHSPAPTAVAQRVGELLPTGLGVVPWPSDADLSPLGSAVVDLHDDVCWVTIDGRILRGHEAVAHCILATRRWWSPLGGILLIPPFSWLARPAWSRVSRRAHRPTTTSAPDGSAGSSGT